jgi:hypothetical protein
VISQVIDWSERSSKNPTPGTHLAPLCIVSARRRAPFLATTSSTPSSCAVLSASPPLSWTPPPSAPPQRRCCPQADRAGAPWRRCTTSKTRTSLVRTPPSRRSKVSIHPVVSNNDGIKIRLQDSYVFSGGVAAQVRVATAVCSASWPPQFCVARPRLCRGSSSSGTHCPFDMPHGSTTPVRMLRIGSRCIQCSP